MPERPPKPADQVTLDPPPARGPAETLPPPESPAGPGSQSQLVTAVLPPHLAHALGRFEVHEFLGEGTFGTVFRAHDTRLDRAVALKVAKSAVESGERAERFRREARASAGLRHPHIVPLYETGEAAGQFYLASAYIPGTTLEDALHDRAGGFAPREAAEITRKLAGALAYAHGQGVVHRDVKSANVILDPQGDPHLLDFGLALRNEGADRMTLDGSVLGTPAYIAPEVATGRRDNWGPATDQYALGVVLYELLTGQTPFSGPVEIVMFLQQTTEPPPPSRVKPAVPRDLEAVCLKCLEKDPARRYADCQALADDLRRWLDGESTLARPAGAVERLAKWARRRPAVAALSAAVVTLFLAGFAGVSWQWYRADAARRRAVMAEDEATRAADAAGRSAATADAANRFMTELFESANPEKALGRKITVEEFLVAAANQLDREPLADQPLTEAAVRQMLGNSLRSLGKVNAAEAPLRQALAIWRREAGDRAPETLAAANDLGMLLYQQNRLPEAEALFLQTLQARTDVLGADNPKTLDSLNNLAALRDAQDQRAEARQLYERVVADRRRALGPGHQDTLLALNNYARLVDALGEPADTASMFRECIDGLSRLRAVGPDHPDTLKAKNNLALHHRTRTGDLGEAERILRGVLAANQKVSGPEHGDTLLALNNLAAVLVERGKFDEAEPMMRAAFELRARSRGPTDAETLQSAYNLAVLLQRRRDFPAAEALCRNTASACRDKLDADDPAVFRFQELHAETLMEQVRWDDAAALLAQVVEGRKAKLGPDAPDTLQALAHRAWLLQHTGKPDDAEGVLRDVLAAWQVAKQKNLAAVALAQLQLAELLAGRGKVDEAAAALKPAEAVAARVAGDHWLRQDVEGVRGGLLLARRQFADAEPLVANAHAKLKDSAAPLQRKAAARERAIRLYEATGRQDKAAELRANPR